MRTIEFPGLILLYISLRQIRISNFSWLFMAVITGGLIQAIYGNLQLWGYFPSHHNLFKMTGSFFNPGPFAGYLASVFPVALADLAFEAWYKYPKDKRVDFNKFCNFILPYRNSDEPLEFGSRRNFLGKYSWVIDSLIGKVSLKAIAEIIINNEKFTYLPDIRTKYPVPLSINQFEKGRFGLCDDQVNYLIQLFRAIGLSSSEDYVEHFGNFKGTGHSWIRLEYGNEIYYQSDLNNVYQYESIPKVYRRTFSKNMDTFGDSHFYLDVTPEYKLTDSFEIKNIFNSSSSFGPPYLCVFDSRHSWYKVVRGKVLNDNLQFHNIGTNCLYLPIIDSVGKMIPVNYPFYIEHNDEIQFYKPENELLDSIILLRKAGFISPRKLCKQRFLDSLNNGIFQGSNDSLFNFSQTLGKISNLSSTQVQKLKVYNEKTFQFVRFYSNKHQSYLAKLEFHNPMDEVLIGKVIKSNCRESLDNEGAFDNDPLTFSGGTDFSLGLALFKPEKIGYILYQARNDDNHIRKGDEYELYYWDQLWKSLGSQIAIDTMLIYYNVPKNSLLWLRDLSRGVEENVFVMDENSRQKFLGFLR